MSGSASGSKHGKLATISTPEANEHGGGDGDRTPKQSPRLRAESDMLMYNEQSPVTPPRPTLGPRSWTSVESSSRWTSFRRNRRRSPEREWSVFGQRMENEGQLRSPESLRLKRRSSRQSVHLNTEATASSTAHSRPDSILEEGSAIQSPVQEAFPPEIPREDSSSLSEYDSDDSHNNVKSSSSSLPPNEQQKVSPWISWKVPEIPILYKNILKCSIAYLIGSLFTFVPLLAHFIGSISAEGDKRPSPSGHMVATVAVYFNPAKTAGAMVEADIYCLLGLAWSSFICLVSMSLFWWLDVKPGWEWLADLIAIVWIGLGMTVVAWMKVWMSKPTFGTACSMTAIILFVVVVKEGGLDTLMQVLFIVIVGSLVSNFVCYTIWPQSAAKNLQNNMSKTLESFSTLLTMLTNTFLLGDSSLLHEPSQGKLQRAVENHQASFTSLKKNLDEARSEWLCGGPTVPGTKGRDNAAKAYEDAVDCMNRLGQHLNGLRSGTRLQYDLTQAARNGKVALQLRRSGRQEVPSFSRRLGREVRAAMKGKTVETDPEPDPEIGADEAATLQAAAVMFGELVDDMGPPLSALSTACTNTLKKLREAFVQKQRDNSSDAAKAQMFIQLSDDIQRALFTFESTSNQAVLRIYRRNNLLTTLSYESSDISVEENRLLAQAGVEECVFLVYYFIFTLQEFAKELTALVDAMSRIYAVEYAAAYGKNRWSERVSRILSCIGHRSKLKALGSEGKDRPGLRRRFSSIILPSTQRRPAPFPKVKPHAPNTVQTPGKEDLSLMGRIKQSIWRIGAKLKQRSVKYAIKAGMATAILASPAFFDKTRPVFTEYRGEWALISYFVVISPTIGGTNFLSFHRVLGTLFGAAAAVIAFMLFPDNPVALTTFGFLYSIPCFYYIVAKPQYATSGRFFLLTYNLTCLYSYNIREEGVHVISVAYHRSASVIIGVLYAFLVSRLWWPSEARRELGKGLSEFCLNIGWLYTHLVAANSGVPVPVASEVVWPENLEEETERALTVPDDSPEVHHETSVLLPKSVAAKINASIKVFMAMELHLQIKLIELQGLLAQTQHEPRLKGPFPVKMYRSILTSLQTILDKLHSMRCVTTREEWFTTVRRDFVLPVNKERREMVGNVVLYFYVLSAAFSLKAPIPPYLPPAEKSRQRLVDAIKQLDIVKNRDVKGSRQLLFFAYALTMKGVIQELDYLGQTLQNAFGVIGQSTVDFESLFTPEPRGFLGPIT